MAFLSVEAKRRSQKLFPFVRIVEELETVPSHSAIFFAKSKIFAQRSKVDLQWLNTDGSFITAVSNSSLSPFEKSHSCRFRII